MAIRIDSGNVGIGTSSPSKPLRLKWCSTDYVARFDQAIIRAVLVKNSTSTSYFENTKWNMFYN